jgi:hypothetical protein
VFPSVVRFPWAATSLTSSLPLQNSSWRWTAVIIHGAQSRTHAVTGTSGVSVTASSICQRSWCCRSLRLRWSWCSQPLRPRVNLATHSGETELPVTTILACRWWTALETCASGAPSGVERRLLCAARRTPCWVRLLANPGSRSENRPRRARASRQCRRPSPDRYSRSARPSRPGSAHRIMPHYAMRPFGLPVPA